MVTKTVMWLKSIVGHGIIPALELLRICQKRQVKIVLISKGFLPSQDIVNLPVVYFLLLPGGITSSRSPIRMGCRLMVISLIKFKPRGKICAEVKPKRQIYSCIEGRI